MPSQADGSAPEARNARSIRGGTDSRSGGNEPPPERRSRNTQSQDSAMRASDNPPSGNIRRKVSACCMSNSEISRHVFPCRPANACSIRECHKDFHPSGFSHSLHRKIRNRSRRTHNRRNKNGSRYGDMPAQVHNASAAVPVHAVRGCLQIMRRRARLRRGRKESPGCIRPHRNADIPPSRDTAYGTQVPPRTDTPTNREARSIPSRTIHDGRSSAHVQ